jgi:hypothetical protein
MHTFFHGWRRKCGVATLIVALAFWCLWVRSLILIDMFDFAFWGCSHRIVVMDGCLAWDRAYPFTADQAAFQDPSGKVAPTGWASIRSGGHISIFDLCGDVKWQWRGLGFAHGSHQAWETTNTVTLIPYWFLAIPLTLLSAYLILWKPRQREAT